MFDTQLAMASVCSANGRARTRRATFQGADHHRRRAELADDRLSVPAIAVAVLPRDRWRRRLDRFRPSAPATSRKCRSSSSAPARASRRRRSAKWRISPPRASSASPAQSLRGRYHAQTGRTGSPYRPERGWGKSRFSPCQGYSGDPRHAAADLGRGDHRMYTGDRQCRLCVEGSDPHEREKGSGIHRKPHPWGSCRRIPPAPPVYVSSKSQELAAKSPALSRRSGWSTGRPVEVGPRGS
jgi:hypothetical protein